MAGNNIFTPKPTTSIINIFRSRLANAIPLLSVVVIAALNLAQTKLGANYYLVAGIALLILFIINIGLFYTRYRDGKVAKSRILLLVVLMVVTMGAWAWFLYNS